MDGGRQVPAPDLNPHAQSHEVLKGMTDAADPAGSQAVADGWAAMASGFDEAAELFQQAMLNSTVGWTGEAAEGMREQLARVATWSKATGARYQAASAAVGEQSAAADSAKTAMPPPVPYDPAQMIRDAAASGNISEMAALPFAMYAQKQKHDAAHDQAAEVVSNRDLAFADAAARVPVFSPPPSLTGDEGGPAEGKAETTRGPGVGRQESQPPPPRPDGIHDAPADRTPAPASESPLAAPASSAPPAVPNPAPGPSVPPAAGTDPSSFVPAAAPAIGAPNPGLNMVDVAAPGSGFGPGSGPAPGLTVAASHEGATGRGPGFGSGGPAAVPAARSGTGVPVAAGARAKSSEDAEHKRPEYLLEPEAEGMFDSDVLTSPPVIGEE